MANQLYNSMQCPNMMSAVQNLKRNPFQFLMQNRFNIPQSIQNDPNAIIQHLMSTGQVSQRQYDNAIKMAQQFKR